MNELYRQDKLNVQPKEKAMEQENLGIWEILKAMNGLEGSYHRGKC